MSISNYKDLIVWQKAMDLVMETYSLINYCPKEENFALSNQMRRAVISIPSNIAEGQQRNSTKEFVHFLSIARGSKGELETQLLICVRLKYLEKEKVDKAMMLCQEIGKMLNTLISKLTTNH